jgi:Na+/H+ antiporter NhaC
VDVVPGGPSDVIMLSSIASVLSGAIFGDHCSPISDTTVLSSTASACDHVDHVRTQLPYALAVAVLAMVLGELGSAYGMPSWLGLAAGTAILFAGLRLFRTDVRAEIAASEG